MPVLSKLTVPPSPVTRLATRNCSVSRLRPRSAWCASRASSRPAGPQARVTRASRSGTSSARSATSSTPCVSSYRATRLIRPARSSSRRLARKIESGSVGATCTTVMSYAALRGRCTAPESATGNRLRSIPITGVMPEPAVTKRNLPPSGGSTNSPAACSRWTRVPDARVVDEVVADLALGHGLDRDRDATVGAGAVGQRVGAPQADAVDVDADRGRTGRARGRPSRRRGGSRWWRRRRSRGGSPRSGPAGRRRGAAGRRRRGSRPAPAGSRRARRRGGLASRDRAHPARAARAGESEERSRGGHDSTLCERAVKVMSLRRESITSSCS